jgi:hypothetical protein
MKVCTTLIVLHWMEASVYEHSLHNKMYMCIINRSIIHPENESLLWCAWLTASCRSGFHMTVHRVKFLRVKPSRCTNFLNLFLESSWIIRKIFEHHTGKITKWRNYRKQPHELGTAAHIHVLRKVRMSKYETFNVGNNVTCTINHNYIIAATLCTPETWFALGM